MKTNDDQTREENIQTRRDRYDRSNKLCLVLDKHNTLWNYEVERGEERMPSSLRKNERMFILETTTEKVTRIGKLVKEFKNTKSKYKYKVKIAPKTYIYVKDF